MKSAREFIVFDVDPSVETLLVIGHEPTMSEVALGLAAILPLFVGEGGDALNNMILAAAYVMMALGLNIVVGFAGLLDLGYVAFYAIGAFVIGWLGSQQFPDVSAGTR